MLKYLKILLVTLVIVTITSCFVNCCPFRDFQIQNIDSIVQASSASAAASFSQIHSLDPFKDLEKYINAPIQHILHADGNYTGISSQNQRKVQCNIPPLTCANKTQSYRYRSFDGSCNNLVYTGYGSSKSRFDRLLPPKYSDKVFSPPISVTGAPLPNARHLSLSLYGDAVLPDNFRTMAFLHWNQIVAHDISRFITDGRPRDCCRDYRNKVCDPIILGANDPITKGSGKKCIHFARSVTDVEAGCPNSGHSHFEQISESTAYLDLSFLYGNSDKESKKFRLFKGGLLKSSWLGEKQLPPISRNTNGECGDNKFQCFEMPDMRNQIVPAMTALHTIILREHNRLAKGLSHLNPHFSDEVLYQEARKINIAQYQKITYYDMLPHLVGPTYAHYNNLIYDYPANEYVNDYDPNVNAAPLAEFSTAAFRYSHNQIPGWFSLVSSERTTNVSLRLTDHLERSENVDFLIDDYNFEGVIRGLATQLQKRPDINIDSEVRHFLFRKAFEIFGEDLKALDIQRGRDFGLASYNDVRQQCGLPRAYTWADFANEIPPKVIAVLQKVYASPDDVDLTVGGSLEAHVPEAIVGPTFQCIVGKQFLKLRTGDRFFFEHEDIYGGFNRAQLAEIRKVSLAGLLCANVKHLRYMQPDVFVYPNARNVLKNCKNFAQLDLSKWRDVPQTSSVYYV